MDIILTHNGCNHLVDTALSVNELAGDLKEFSHRVGLQFNYLQAAKDFKKIQL